VFVDWYVGLGTNVCRLVCGPRHQSFSGVYCHRLKSEDGRSMFIRNVNPQDYNVRAGTPEYPSFNTPLAYCFTSNIFQLLTLQSEDMNRHF
jgi:hypothetical protein